MGVMGSDARGRVAGAEDSGVAGAVSADEAGRSAEGRGRGRVAMARVARTRRPEPVFVEMAGGADGSVIVGRSRAVILMVFGLRVADLADGLCGRPVGERVCPGIREKLHRAGDVH